MTHNNRIKRTARRIIFGSVLFFAALGGAAAYVVATTDRGCMTDSLASLAPMDTSKIDSKLQYKANFTSCYGR